MPDSPIDVRTQLLNAAVETAATHGLSRLSMGDVARRAGLSRQTLYRHFPSKESLISAVIVSEAAVLIEEVIAATESLTDPREALEAAILATLRATREHPLLDRLLRTEPETLLPLLTTDGGPLMAQVRVVVESIVGARMGEDTTSGDTLDADHLRRFADIVTRLLISYAVSAPTDPPEIVAATIAAFLIDGALATTRPNT